MRLDDKRIDVKTVLITGASKGIGYATAKHFLDSGNKVIAVSRNIQLMQPLFHEFPERCLLFSLDLESQTSIKQLADSLIARSISLNYVIHNAGNLVNKPFLEVSPDDLLRCYQTNIIGPYLLTQSIFSLLASNSHTVAISSMGGFQGSVKFPGLTAYSSSKAAIASLMECLQAEYADYSHAFNALCIGSVQTEMLQNAFPGYNAPLQSHQMAAFIYQFTTTANQYIRGKTLPISLSTP